MNVAFLSLHDTIFCIFSVTESSRFTRNCHALLFTFDGTCTLNQIGKHKTLKHDIM